MITISVNAKDIEKLLGKVSTRLKNDMQMWNHVGQDIHGNIIQHFRQEVDENGERWERWRIGNKRYNERPGWGGASAMLQKHGDMRRATTWKPRINSVSVNNATPYAIYHHTGVHRGRFMDKRRFLYVNKKELLDLCKVVIQDLFRR